MVRSIVGGSLLCAMAVAVVCSLAGCTPAADTPQTDVLAALKAATEDSVGAQPAPQLDEPVVTVKASINGQDANDPPGPFIVVGDPVAWTAVVTNEDTDLLTDIEVVDDEFGTASCPATQLDAGASMTCTLASTATAGQHSSTAQVTAKRSDGSSAENTDPTHYVGVPQGPLACSAGGPYTGECENGSATIQLSAQVISAPSGATLQFAWTSTCPGFVFDDETSPVPVLTADASGGCSTDCKVSLTVSDGTSDPSTCEADVTIADTQAPVFDAQPEDLTLECGDADNEAKVQAWLEAVTATDACGAATVTNDFTELPAPCADPVTVTWTAKDDCDHATTASARLAVEDTQAPVFDAQPEDLTLECGDADNEAKVQAWLEAVTATDACGTASVTNDFTELPAPCADPLTVTWTATDACGLTVQVSAALKVVDDTVPVITLNGEPTVVLECHTDTYTELGAIVEDPCDTTLTEATVGGDVVDVNTPGTYVVTYDAMDACGNAAQQVTRTVEVVDTIPPVIKVGEPLELWPPNHEYEEYELSDLATVEDACDASLDIDAMGKIMSIYSDEPEDVNGNGDGNTMQDIVILGPSSFKVRAERQGAGNGRVYGITFMVTDAAGNETTTTAYIGVPHDQSGEPAVDDGLDAGYAVAP